MKVTKVPVIGAGSGFGVVVDKRSDSRCYLRVSRLEIGGGIGAQKFKVVIVFQDGALLDRAASGTWRYDFGAEVAAGTVRVARAKPYLD